MDEQQNSAPPAPATPVTQDSDIVDNKDIAALGYMWVLSVFAYFYRRNSPFVRHHARQGIVLFVLSIVCWSIPFVGRFLELGVLALVIMGFLNAAQGKYAPLPLIYAVSHGDIKMLRQSWKTVVDAIVALWHRIRSRKATPAVKVSVETTSPSPDPTPSPEPADSAVHTSMQTTPQPSPASDAEPPALSLVPPIITASEPPASPLRPPIAALTSDSSASSDSSDSSIRL